MASARALRQLASAKLTYFQLMRLDPLVNETKLAPAILINPLQRAGRRCSHLHEGAPPTFSGPADASFDSERLIIEHLVLWVSRNPQRNTISINLSMSQLDENLVE
jgi:hypothetical protein